MVCYDRTIFGGDATIWKSGRMQKNLNMEKITFKVVQMKYLAMHITNQKLRFDIFDVGNVHNIFMEHDLNILMIFGIKEKWVILTHSMYCCLLLQIYLCCLWLHLCSRDTYLIWVVWDCGIVPGQWLRRRWSSRRWWAAGRREAHRAAWEKLGDDRVLDTNTETHQQVFTLTTHAFIHSFSPNTSSSSS